MGGSIVSKDDVIESFVRSSGPGGQNVNKVSSCVVLIHKPTGTLVKCQAHRSQYLNRQQAWAELEDKIKEQLLELQRKKKAALSKVRRQNRKRSINAKERMLQTKKKNSLKKQQRKKSYDE